MATRISLNLHSFIASRIFDERWIMPFLLKDSHQRNSKSIHRIRLSRYPTQNNPPLHQESKFVSDKVWNFCFQWGFRKKLSWTSLVHFLRFIVISSMVYLIKHWFTVFLQAWSLIWTNGIISFLRSFLTHPYLHCPSKDQEVAPTTMNQRYPSSRTQAHAQGPNERAKLEKRLKPKSVDDADCSMLTHIFCASSFFVQIVLLSFLSNEWFNKRELRRWTLSWPVCRLP